MNNFAENTTSGLPKEEEVWFFMNYVQRGSFKVGVEALISGGTSPVHWHSGMANATGIKDDGSNIGQVPSAKELMAGHRKTPQLQ